MVISQQSFQSEPQVPNISENYVAGGQSRMNEYSHRYLYEMKMEQEVLQ